MENTSKTKHSSWQDVVGAFRELQNKEERKGITDRLLEEATALPYAVKGILKGSFHCLEQGGVIPQKAYQVLKEGSRFLAYPQESFREEKIKQELQQRALASIIQHPQEFFSQAFQKLQEGCYQKFSHFLVFAPAVYIPQFLAHPGPQHPGGSPVFRPGQYNTGNLLQQPGDNAVMAGISIRFGNIDLLFVIFGQARDIIPAFHEGHVVVVGMAGGRHDIRIASWTIFGTLAHELGHQHYRHGLKRAGRTLLWTVLLNLVMGKADTTSMHVALQLTAASYSRSQEQEADVFALTLVHQVYGDTRGALEFFELMQREYEQQNPQWMHFLSSHPPTAERLAYLQRLQQQLRQQP